MKKIIYVATTVLSLSAFAQHNLDSKIDTIKSLTPTEDILVKKQTKSTKLGDKCLLVHESLASDLVLDSSMTLNVEDIYSNIATNSFGLISGYAQYAVAIPTSGIVGIKGIICEAGSVEKGGTAFSRIGYVDPFVMKYKTSFEDLEKFLQKYVVLDLGERSERPVLNISGLSSHLFAEEETHASSAVNSFKESADEKCRNRGFTAWRGLGSEWSAGINVRYYKLTGKVKCLNL